MQVLPHRREVLVDGQPLDVGSRAFDLLVTLIQARGSVVSKDDLIERVWPGRVVDENALQAHISTLRKALGAQRNLIRTVAGRGYQFIGELRAAAPAAQPRPSATNLPERMSELIGRDDLVNEVLALMSQYRLVTLTGAGGVGKTRLAIEVARHLQPRFRDGVWVAQLGPLSDADLLPAVVASALGLTPASGTGAIERVCAAVGSRQTLLVLDNCEHVVDAAACMAEGLLSEGSDVRIIATSQVPLDAEGEYVCRVPSLDVPTETATDASDSARSGAVRLFVARARESAPRFSLDDRLAAKVAGICRRLDGIPLAIELAAKRTGALGVDELAARLDDRFGLLTGGKRTALPRQQTLRATLDWSHELLAEPERVVLRRLAVFAGAFSLSAAIAVASGDDFSESDVVGCVVSLVNKSLVESDTPELHAGYRLLQTTRSYAFEKLVASGEFAPCARRHAEHCDRDFQRAQAEWETELTQDWLARYSPCIANVRAALDWAFSRDGDAQIGVALTVAAVPLLLQLSLIDECLGLVERALRAVVSGVVAGERRAMQLHAAHGWSLMYTTGMARETGAAWSAALELARRLDDADYEMRALWGLWAGHMNNGEFQAALALAERFGRVASKSVDASDLLVGERMRGVALHFLGDQTAARQCIEHVLRHYVAPPRRSHVVRFQFEQRVTALMTHARVLWLQGFPDQAMRAVDMSLNEAVSLDQSLTTGNTLAQAACPIALLCGDLPAAERFITMFLNHTSRRALGVWHTYGICFRGMLLIKRGNAHQGVQLLRSGVDELRGVNFTQYQTAFLLALAEGLVATGQVVEAMTTIDEGLERSKRSDERWCLPELLRVKGEIELSSGTANAAPAEAHFIQSIDCARRQGALSWELRTSTSLARLRHAQGRAAQARAVLAPVLERFSEGLETADLVAARALLSLLP